MQSKIKQMLCLHWFDSSIYEEERSMGQIVGIEQRLFKLKIEKRVCSKCGLTEKRQLDIECLGWF